MSDPVHVLVVDDDDDVRETLEIVLDHAGFRVSSATNGQEALAFVRAAAAAPVMLLDLRMPVMSGWEVIDALRDEGRLGAVPIIICTSSPGDSPDGFEIVPKPVALGTLVDAIHRVAPTT